MYGHPDAVRHSLRMAMHFFIKFDIFKWLYLAYYWVNLHQTWGFCKAWSALYDYVDHVIHRLVPSLYRFEIMQCDELSKQSPTIKSFNLAVPQTPLLNPIGKFRVTRKKLRKGP